MNSHKPETIDEYLAGLPEDARTTLASMRRTIKGLVPDAAESISYGVPTFKYHGRPLAYIGAAKKHCAFYGASVDKHRQQLTGYDVDKGTIRYPMGQPLPESLVKLLLDGRIAEIDAAAASKRKQPAARREA